MKYFSIHVGNLFLHLRNILLTRSYVSLQLLDLVIQHKLELLQLLSLLLQLVDTSALIPDGFIPLLDLLRMTLPLLSQLLVCLLNLLDILQDLLQLRMLFLQFLGFCIILRLLGSLLTLRLIMLLKKNFHLSIILDLQTINLILRLILQLISLPGEPVLQIHFIIVKSIIKLLLAFLLILVVSLFLDHDALMVLLEVLDESLELIELLLLLPHQVLEPLLLQLYLLLELRLNSLLIRIMRVLYRALLLIKLLLHLTFALQQVIKLLLFIPLNVLNITIQFPDSLITILGLQMQLHLLLHSQLVYLSIYDLNYIHSQSLDLYDLLLILISRNQEFISKLWAHTILIQLDFVLLLHQLVDHNGTI